MQRSELIHLNSLENFNKQWHFVDELIYLLKILLNIETKVILSFWYIYILHFLLNRWMWKLSASRHPVRQQSSPRWWTDQCGRPTGWNLSQRQWPSPSPRNQEMVCISKPHQTGHFLSQSVIKSVKGRYLGVSLTKRD